MALRAVIRLPVLGNLLLVALGLAAVALLLLLAELAVRTGLPHVNDQRTDARLFQPDPGPSGVAWAPGASGTCFGQPVEIDALGHRAIGGPGRWDEAWLILGDSVTFGIGVAAEDSFAGMLQRAHPDVKVFNTAVVGMHLAGYRAVAEQMLEAHPSIGRVLLFYTLNDLLSTVALEGREAPAPDVAAPPRPRHLGFDSILNWNTRPAWAERIVALGRENSRLFQLLKGTLFDPGRLYFEWDAALYEVAARDPEPAFAAFLEIAHAAAQRGIAFDVFLLPYEYQLRMDRPELWQPQRLLGAYLARHGIAHLDTRHAFLERSEDSRDFFLFADPMHLSVAGHRVVYDVVSERLP